MYSCIYIRTDSDYHPAMYLIIPWQVRFFFFFFIGIYSLAGSCRRSKSKFLFSVAILFSVKFVFCLFSFIYLLFVIYFLFIFNIPFHLVCFHLFYSFFGFVFTLPNVFRGSLFSSANFLLLFDNSFTNWPRGLLAGEITLTQLFHSQRSRRPGACYCGNIAR